MHTETHTRICEEKCLERASVKISPNKMDVDYV